jgi:predicted porin
VDGPRRPPEGRQRRRLRPRLHGPTEIHRHRRPGDRCHAAVPEFTEDVGATLAETHLSYLKGPFGLRALYAAWDIDDGIETFKAGASEQEGWYVEPSWRFGPQWGVFARYSEWDNQAGASLDTAYDQWDLGLSYWLEESVVFKLDYQRQDAPEGKDQLDGLNLGVGVSF